MVKRVIEYTKFNIYPTALTTNLFATTPSYVIKSIIAFCFLLLVGILAFAFYYTYKKFKSIDNHTNKKYGNHNNKQNTNNPDTYKEDIKEYKQDIDGLDAKVMPDGQTVSNAANKIIEFVNGIKK